MKIIQFKLIWELMKKDWEEAIKSKQVILSTTVLPLILVLLVPVIMIVSINFASEEEITSEFEVFMDLLPPITSDWNKLSDKGQIMIISAIIGQLFLLLVPIMIASFICADTIIGEKERSTIEGLLSLPLTDGEILLAKINSTVLPVLCLTWIMSLIYSILVDFLTFNELGRILLPDLRFILLIIFLTPLLAFGTTTFVIMISSRVSTARDAQQLTGIIILPAIFLLGGQLIIIFINIWFILVGIVILTIVDFIAYKFAINMFDRERLMNYS